MNITRNFGKNFVIAVDANEPINARNKCRQKNFKRRNFKLEILDELRMAGNGDYFADECDNSEEIADPEFRHPHRRA